MMVESDGTIARRSSYLDGIRGSAKQDYHLATGLPGCSGSAVSAAMWLDSFSLTEACRLTAGQPLRTVLFYTMADAGIDH